MQYKSPISSIWLCTASPRRVRGMVPGYFLRDRLHFALFFVQGRPPVISEPSRDRRTTRYRLGTSLAKERLETDINGYLLAQRADGWNVSRFNNLMQHVRARRRQALLGCALPPSAIFHCLKLHWFAMNAFARHRRRLTQRCVSLLMREEWRHPSAHRRSVITVERSAAGCETLGTILASRSIPQIR